MRFIENDCDMKARTGSLGQLIARLLDEHDMTIVDLSKQLGIHPSNAGRKIRGEAGISHTERRTRRA